MFPANSSVIKEVTLGEPARAVEIGGRRGPQRIQGRGQEYRCEYDLDFRGQEDRFQRFLVFLPGHAFMIDTKRASKL